MYCPHCGRSMQLIGGVLTCATGAMSPSSAMQAALTDRFPSQQPRAATAEVGRQLNRWYCPGCGVPLDPGMVCRKCGKSIHDQLFGLVDFHPHTAD